VGQKVGSAQSGKGGIIGLEEVFIEVFHIVSQGQGFSHTGVACKEEDPASLLDVIHPCGGLFKGFGMKGIFGFDVFVKGHMFKSEPGE
jgi:hypothetical protein